MRLYLTVMLTAVIFLIQGCSEKKTPNTFEKPKLEKQNIDELNHQVNIFLNKKYAIDIQEELEQNVHYDLEYVNTPLNTYAFVLFKNSFMFCGSGGCSVKVLEYKNESILEIESLTLVSASIYLVHDLSPSGFSKIVVPVSYLDETKWATYYNVYNPFAKEEHRGVYPQDIGYKELKMILNDRKLSIKLFTNVEK